MEKTDAVIASLLTQFQKFGEAYGKDALELAVQGTALVGIQTLASGLACALVATVLWTLVCKAYHQPWFTEDNDATQFCMFFFFGGGVSVILTVAAVVNLFTVSAWYALFNPKVYIAYQIVSKAFK